MKERELTGNEMFKMVQEECERILGKVKGKGKKRQKGVLFFINRNWKVGLIMMNMSFVEQQKIVKLATKPGGFPKVTENGVWGDPTGATKKDGKKFLAEIVRNLAKECQS